jgi:hypothetical protein
MIGEKYAISFQTRLEHTDKLISLTANVEVHHSETSYHIRDFKTFSNPSRAVLPDIQIKKVRGKWVHCDSEKESKLSIEVGKVIDEHEERGLA